MRNMLSLTGLQARYKAAVALAQESGKSVQIPDGEGLMLVVRSTGASWVLRSMVQGRRTDITLGRWPSIGLQDARHLGDEARRKRVQGIDVTAERRTKRLAAKADAAAKADTVRKLYEDWLRLRGDTISDVYRGNIEAGFMKDVLPAIGSKAPHEVTRADCVAVLRTVEARGATVMLRRLRMWLRQMFEFGIDDERRPLLASLPVPTGHLTSFKRDKKGNFPAIVDPTVARQLVQEIRRLDKYINRAALLLSAYTFQRPTEIREAVWEEFDLDAGIWRISAHRMWFKAEHWVPLPRQCVQDLRGLQGVVGDTGLLFPGRKLGKPISEGTLQSQLASMGYEGRHTPHGFRAMARTILVERLRVNKVFVEKQLSHGTDDSGMRGAYDRAEYWEDRVQMMQVWADFLMVQGGWWVSTARAPVGTRARVGTRPCRSTCAFNLTDAPLLRKRSSGQFKVGRLLSCRPQPEVQVGQTFGEEVHGETPADPVAIARVSLRVMPSSVRLTCSV